MIQVHIERHMGAPIGAFQVKQTLTSDIETKMKDKNSKVRKELEDLRLKLVAREAKMKHLESEASKMKQYHEGVNSMSKGKERSRYTGQKGLPVKDCYDQPSTTE